MTIRLNVVVRIVLSSGSSYDDEVSESASSDNKVSGSASSDDKVSESNDKVEFLQIIK